MNSDDVRSRIEMMKATVEPWHKALADPAKAQETVLERLLKGYSQTDYGKKCNSEKVGSYTDFQKAFPVSTFADFKPYIDQVMAGNTHALLSEEPVAIAFTKGTTGQPKLFPYTPSHVNLSLDANYRGSFNYSLFKNDFEWLSGYMFNIVPTANLGKIKVGEKELHYGYSMAITMLYVNAASKSSLKMVPSKEEMDMLPREPSKENWEKRYEMVYQQAREKNVTYFPTMPAIALGFGRYLHREHHIYPKDIWQVKYMGTSGYPGINTLSAPAIHTLYGKSLTIRETYASTEGLFGIQVDDKKAWSPLYDHLFFEVQTISGIKQLHEMYPGEVGTLVVSTPDVPRYRIGDLILAFEAPYFRCIGRENSKLHPYNFGKLTGKSAIRVSASSPLNSWR
jgi:hypothetical protein